jgi:hypothetical protein
MLKQLAQIFKFGYPIREGLSKTKNAQHRSQKPAPHDLLPGKTRIQL